MSAVLQMMHSDPSCIASEWKRAILKLHVMLDQQSRFGKDVYFAYCLIYLRIRQNLNGRTRMMAQVQLHFGLIKKFVGRRPLESAKEERPMNEDSSAWSICAVSWMLKYIFLMAFDFGFPLFVNNCKQRIETIVFSEMRDIDSLFTLDTGIGV